MGSGVGDVDLASQLVAAGDHEQTAEGDVLADHHSQLCDLGVAEVLAKLLLEADIHCPEVAGELLGEAHCEGFAGRELPLGLRKVDL